LYLASDYMIKNKKSFLNKNLEVFGMKIWLTNCTVSKPFSFRKKKRSYDLKVERNHFTLFNSKVKKKEHFYYKIYKFFRIKKLEIRRIILKAMYYTLISSFDWNFIFYY